jgi:hypothetical protein
MITVYTIHRIQKPKKTENVKDNKTKTNIEKHK